MSIGSSHSRTTARHLPEMYAQSAKQYGGLPAFATRREAGRWEATSFRDLYEHGINLATALIDLGVNAQENVGLLADNRIEWIIADFGVQLCGAVDVPRGTDVTDTEIDYILNHCGARVVFVEHKDMLKKVEAQKGKLKKVKHLIVMAPGEAARGTKGLWDLIEQGKALREKGDRRAEERIAALREDDLFTIIYTSGTTGQPKGVMLTHSNILSQIRRLQIPISENDRILSILPVWHIFERAFEMLAVAQGCCTYYTNVRRLGDDMKAVRPTFMGSTPRLWESIYLRILDNVKVAHPIRRGLFHAAYWCSHVFNSSTDFLMGRAVDVTGRNPIVSLGLAAYHAVRWVLVLPFYGFFNAAVIDRLRQATGGNLRGSVSGGGALPLHVDEFFNYIGVPVLEGYGMTETAPVLAVRTFERLVIGTVGPIFPDTELRILDLGTGKTLFPDPSHPKGGRGLKGEIHVRGPQVMKGYYNNKEATDRVLVDGWMNTGDLGMVTFDNSLKIMGRSKDTVVLSGGENVEPVPIENKLCESPLIDQCMIVGQDQKFLAALIVPSLEGFKKAGVLAGDLGELLKKPEVSTALRAEVKRLISGDNGFKGFERVSDLRPLPKAFEVGEEMTNLFKLKRHVITHKYQQLIEEIYPTGKRK